MITSPHFSNFTINQRDYETMSPEQQNKTMTFKDIARTSNEWMRRYIEEPSKFAAEFKTIAEFQRQENEGKEPDYGDICALYSEQLLAELNEELTSE